ncbi:MAG: DASS family sodium-coupled anion symporter [Eubacteriaceae bacterium]|nr:DASS family sodium-coupled anion symporter [Eubacteriaceae bacterium]
MKNKNDLSGNDSKVKFIQTENKSTVKRSILGIVIAVIAGLLVYYLLPAGNADAGGLMASARSLAALFTAAIVLWAMESLPVAVTSLLILALMPLLGISKSLGSAVASFSSPVIFFIIASFVLSLAVEKSGLGRRFALMLINHTGTGSKTAIFVFMFGCATTSTFLSDVPSSVIWMTLSLPILNNLNLKPGSNFGKAIMIGIPIAALIGGVATPAGSSINILALSLIKSIANIDITFFQWMGLGVPMYLIMIVIAWFVLITIIPPEIESIGEKAFFVKEQQELGKWSTREYKTAIIMMISMVLWVASSWIRTLDIVQIAIFAAVVMFLPGVSLVDWDDVHKYTGWNVVLLVGSVMCLGFASVDTGLSAWVVQNVLSGIGAFDVIWVTIILSAFTVIIHLPIPINPALIAAVIPPIIGLATSTGVNPALYCIPVAFTASCAFLLPLDTVILITYPKGYYKMLDMFVPGLIISVFWVLVMSGLTIALGPVLGFN